MYAVASGILQSVSPTSTETAPIFWAAAFASFSKETTVQPHLWYYHI